MCRDKKVHIFTNELSVLNFYQINCIPIFLVATIYQLLLALPPRLYGFWYPKNLYPNQCPKTARHHETRWATASERKRLDLSTLAKTKKYQGEDNVYRFLHIVCIDIGKIN